MANPFKWFGNQCKAAIDKQIDTRQLAAGHAVVEKAKELVPKKTYQLHDSIGFTYRQSDHTLTIHADAPYALFVETGTRWMMAQPYMRPAINEARRIWGSKLVMEFPNTPTLKGTNRRPNVAVIKANRASTARLEGRFKASRKAAYAIGRGQWNGPKRPWHPKRLGPEFEAEVSLWGDQGPGQAFL